MLGFRAQLISLAILLGGLAVAVPTAAQQPPPADFVVHEWGVITTDDRLDPTAAPPPFVHRASEFAPQDGPALRKPVMYFYPGATAGRGAIDVRVGIPAASFDTTIFYPGAAVEGLSPRGLQVPGLHFTLRTGGDHRLPPNPPAWWVACRVPGAASVASADGEGEGFLFYETRIDVPGRPSFSLEELDGPLARVTAAPTGMSDVVAIARWGSAVHVGAVDTVATGATPAFSLSPASAEIARREVRDRLVRAGLYEAEANALVRVWSDSLDGDPAVVLYRLDPTVVSSLVPLTVTPAPASLVRVWLVMSPLR